MNAVKRSLVFVLALGFVLACGNKDNGNDRNGAGIQAADVKDAETAARFYKTMLFSRAAHTGEAHSYLQADPIALPKSGAQFHWGKVNLLMQTDHKLFLEYYTVLTSQNDPKEKLEGDATADGFEGNWAQKNMSLDIDTPAAVKVGEGKAHQAARGSSVSVTFLPSFPIRDLAGKTFIFYKNSKRRELKEDLRDTLKHYDLSAHNKIDLGDL
jgi:hypothetical protein